MARLAIPVLMEKPDRQIAYLHRPKNQLHHQTMDREMTVPVALRGGEIAYRVAKEPLGDSQALWMAMLH